MDPRLQALIDRFEIIDVLNEYCHGCDRMDEARMAGTYWPDSWDDHGPTKCDGHAFARQVTANMAGDSESLSHQLGQSIIRIDGDSAGADTYFIAVQRRNVDGKEQVDQLGGRYVDRLERRDGKWKIKDRLCIREWSISLPVELDWLAGRGFAEGQRARTDPSYAVLGLT